MMPERLAMTVLSIFAVSALFGCSAKHAHSASIAKRDIEPYVAAARSSSLESLVEANRGKARDLAEKGIAAAERCIALDSDEPGCFYWRAVATGLYHRVHVIGYQRGVKRMIDDCRRVIDLDPAYDHAGAYRILGEIYTQLPQTGGRADSITRDLDLAEQYLREAITLAPEYPENHIALAKTLLEKENLPETTAAIRTARNLAPQWKQDISYDDWRRTMLALEKKIKKAHP